MSTAPWYSLGQAVRIPTTLHGGSVMQLLAAILILFHTIGAILVISQIGEPRKPITRSSAYLTAVFNIAIIIAVAVLGSAASS
jgi:hypothetical protein